MVEYPLDLQDLQWKLSGPETAELVDQQLDQIELGRSTDLRERLKGEDGHGSARNLAQAELGMCPGSKAGGITFVEDDRRWDHLLTLSWWEWESYSIRRWLPVEDQRLLASPGMPLGLKDIDSERLKPLEAPTGLQPVDAARVHLFVNRKNRRWKLKATFSDD
ncbi:MAG: hypothetical protein K2W96_27880 [Gemmataceae bacterium]|nr:hypothetical protein [Gemmataceae bacterium]